MIRHRAPILMGGLMGLAMPWMMHLGDSGAVFILAHVAIVAALAGLAFIRPALRRSVHRPDLRHLPSMLTATALIWATTCLYCLAVDGIHWS